MGQNLFWGKTQTATQTPKGHNGVGSMGGFLWAPTHYHLRGESQKYYASLKAWDTRQELAPLREFFSQQPEKSWETQIVCARGVSEGILFVLPSSCSITPPAGEGGPSSNWWVEHTGVGRCDRGFSEPKYTDFPLAPTLHKKHTCRFSPQVCSDATLS